MFHTAFGLCIAKGYSRIVLGKRGPYIEFYQSNIVWPRMRIPIDQSWRITDNQAYYIEYRSQDKSRIKMYLQKRLVDYADYKVRLCYISPFDLYVNDQVVIEKLKYKL